MGGKGGRGNSVSNPREGQGLRKPASCPADRDSCTPSTDGPAVGGHLGSRQIHRGGPHTDPPSPAGDTQSDLGWSGPRRLLPASHPGLCIWAQPHGPPPRALLIPKQEEVLSVPAELQVRVSSSRVFCPMCGPGRKGGRWAQGLGPRHGPALHAVAGGTRFPQRTLWAVPGPYLASSLRQDSAQRRSCSPKAGPRVACHSALLPRCSQ